MKIFISGYGRMGRIVESVLLSEKIVCSGHSEDIQATDPAIARESVCIDFTTPAAFRENYRFIATHFQAAVVGTTGWYDIAEQVFEAFREAGATLIWASNFSIGVNVLFATVRKAAGLLGGTAGYTPYIVEKHHCHKRDAPSGTAVTLGREIQAGTGIKPEIASIRAGEIPGIHTVSFEGKYDRLTIEHEAFSGRGFAEGAVRAALLTEKYKGVFEFKDLLFRHGD